MIQVYVRNKQKIHKSFNSNICSIIKYGLTSTKKDMQHKSVLAVHHEHTRFKQAREQYFHSVMI